MDNDTLEDERYINKKQEQESRRQDIPAERLRESILQSLYGARLITRFMMTANRQPALSGPLRQLREAIEEAVESCSELVPPYSGSECPADRLQRSSEAGRSYRRENELNSPEA